jgi:hemoglobin-like flavoprotein
MTQQERQLVRDSFQEIGDMAGPLSLLFYGRLFELDPSLRPMFHGDIARQGRKLMDMIGAVVEHIDELETLTPVLHAMGQRHAAYGVIPAHYDIVETALLWALGQALGPEFDRDVKAAWRAVIGKVSTGMKEGAAQLGTK